VFSLLIRGVSLGLDHTFSLAALHVTQAVRDPLMMFVVVTFTRK
jgi:hypothetical protein